MEPTLEEGQDYQFPFHYGLSRDPQPEGPETGRSQWPTGLGQRMVSHRKTPAVNGEKRKWKRNERVQRPDWWDPSKRHEGSGQHCHWPIASEADER